MTYKMRKSIRSSMVILHVKAMAVCRENIKASIFDIINVVFISLEIIFKNEKVIEAHNFKRS